jgi:hypothetical protein
MKGMLDEKTRRNKHMENEFNTVKAELDACRRATAMGHVYTSSVVERELPRTVSRQDLQSHDRNRKLYSRVFGGCADRKYKLTLRSKANQHLLNDQEFAEVQSEPYGN